MKWLELSISAPPEYVEPLSHIFYRYGHGGTVIEQEGGFNPDEGELDPWNRSVNWNGKLVYTHGGGCRSGWHQQGNRTGGVMRQG